MAIDDFSCTNCGETFHDCSCINKKRHEVQFVHENCKECGLHKYSSKPFCQARGNDENPKIIMIGEAPGPDEARQGVCFVGRAGRKLDEMIKPYKNDIYITNMVKCFPPISTTNPTKGFRVPKESEVTHCRPFLIQEILKLQKNFNPILMTLGNVALKGLLPDAKGITQELGIGRRVCVETSDNIFELVPNYHPSYILRNPSMQKEFERVLRECMEI